MTAPDAQPLGEELRGIEERLRRLGEEWADGASAVASIALRAASERLTARHRELTDRLRVRQQGMAFANLPDPLRPVWPSLPMSRRRAIVAALVESVTIGPGTGGNRFDPRRIQEIRWRH